MSKPKGLTPKQQDQIEEEYGLAYALFKAFPELKGLLNKAIDESWTPAKFQVEFRQTKWFKSHNDNWRKMIALYYSDPKSYHERLLNYKTSMQNVASSMGVALSKETFHTLARRGMLFGWDEAQLRDVLSNYVRPSDQGHYGGELAAAENNLTQLAHANGIQLRPKMVKNWMQRIARGDASQDQFASWIRDQAAATYKLYGEQIKGGMNVSDIATPYINQMAETLELNPQGIDAFDPTIRRALSGVKNKKGEREELSVTDFEDQLRRDKRWQYTQAAQEQARGYAAAIGRMWGLR